MTETKDVLAELDAIYKATMDLSNKMLAFKETHNASDCDDTTVNQVAMIQTINELIYAALMLLNPANHTKTLTKDWVDYYKNHIASMFEISAGIFNEISAKHTQDASD